MELWENDIKFNNDIKVTKVKNLLRDVHKDIFDLNDGSGEIGENTLDVILENRETLLELSDIYRLPTTKIVKSKYKRKKKGKEKELDYQYIDSLNISMIIIELIDKMNNKRGYKNKHNNNTVRGIFKLYRNLMDKIRELEKEHGDGFYYQVAIYETAKELDLLVGGMSNNG